MAAIVWTRQGREDVEAIRNFIGRNSPRTADTFVEWIISSVNEIERFPFSGGVVPELNRENIREIIRGRYRVIYRASDERVEILTVHHSARLLDESRLN
jgi:plasmid stabilization system protein ParE